MYKWDIDNETYEFRKMVVGHFILTKVVSAMLKKIKRKDELLFFNYYY